MRRLARSSAPVLAGALVLGVAACSAGTALPDAGQSSTANPAPASTATSPSASVGERRPSSSTPSAPGAGPSPARPMNGPNLVGDTRNTWAFAPLSHPEQVVIEGHVGRQRAWSTSKVLVAAAFLATVTDSDPDRLTPAQRSAVARALSESHLPSLLALKASIPGGASRPMEAVLRSVGDFVTSVPETNEGTMTWTVREQVRFLVALAGGKVVSPKASAFLLSSMRPVASQAWGLSTVGATAVKGGWLRGDTETRQIGILDGHAVAIVTDAVGPAALQSDGDHAHTAQMNSLAAAVKARLNP